MADEFTGPLPAMVDPDSCWSRYQHDPIRRTLYCNSFGEWRWQWVRDTFGVRWSDLGQQVGDAIGSTAGGAVTGAQQGYERTAPEGATPLDVPWFQLGIGLAAGGAAIVAATAVIVSPRSVIGGFTDLLRGRG